MTLFNTIQPYSNIYQIPIPVRLSNLFLDYLPQIFPHYLQPILGKPNVFHGTNYTVYPYKNIPMILETSPPFDEQINLLRD